MNIEPNKAYLTTAGDIVYMDELRRGWYKNELFDYWDNAGNYIIPDSNQASLLLVAELPIGSDEFRLKMLEMKLSHLTDQISQRLVIQV